jgi:predicted phage gp36 major capsid-like protein
MKKLLLVSVLGLLAFVNANAQKWDELNDEQKMMKLKNFRAENQKYLKETLKMTKQQMDDIDAVNICYLSTLDRINRYGKTDEGKEKAANAVSDARSVQLDYIMGEEKHQQYTEYLKKKLESIQKKNKSTSDSRSS